jgi:hypothetical protein
VQTKLLQTPATQTLPAGQTFPQAPQLPPSLCKSAHAPPQQVRPLALQSLPQAPQFESDEMSVQTPPQHASPAAQTFPQPPQFASDVRLVQLPLQHARPAAHVT